MLKQCNLPFTFMTLEQTVEEAVTLPITVVALVSWAKKPFVLTTKHSNGNTIPVHTDVVGRGVDVYR